MVSKHTYDSSQKIIEARRLLAADSNLFLIKSGSITFKKTMISSKTQLCRRIR
jgi:hypothetical protein